MVRTITRETKREGQKTQNLHEPKTNLDPLMIGSYFTHNPSNVIYMQIVRFNSNGRSKTNITRQHNLLFYNRG